jgi:hypothetical protein
MIFKNRTVVGNFVVDMYRNDLKTKEYGKTLKNANR